MFKKPFNKRPGEWNDRGRDAGARHTELYPAVCSKCGKACEVPFRPNGRKPVYCRDCFSAERGAPNRDFAPRPFEAPSGGDAEIAALKRQVAAMNVKIDTMLRILEGAPRAEAPREPAAPRAPSKTDLQEAIRKDLVKKRVAKKARAKR